MEITIKLNEEKARMLLDTLKQIMTDTYLYREVLIFSTVETFQTIAICIELINQIKSQLVETVITGRVEVIDGEGGETVFAGNFQTEKEAQEFFDLRTATHGASEYPKGNRYMWNCVAIVNGQRHIRRSLYSNTYKREK